MNVNLCLKIQFLRNLIDTGTGGKKSQSHLYVQQRTNVDQQKNVDQQTKVDQLKR